MSRIAAAPRWRRLADALLALLATAVFASFQEPPSEAPAPLQAEADAVTAAIGASQGTQASVEAVERAIDHLRSTAASLGGKRYPDAYVAHFELQAVWKLAEWGAATRAQALAEQALARDFGDLDANRWLRRSALLGALADLARQNGQREEAQARLEAWEAFLPRSEGLRVARADVLWERYSWLSLVVALALDRGMPDEAMARMPELVELQHAVAAEPETHPANRKASWYYVQRTNLLALLALDRLEDAKAHFASIRKRAEYDDLEPVLQLGLQQCAALAAAAAIIRGGKAREERESPFRAILANSAFEQLSHAERAEAYLVEAAFQLEHAGIAGARGPFERWRELEARWDGQPQAYHVAVRGWGLRARMLALETAPADAAARAELAAVRDGFRALLERAREITRDAPSAVLHYGEIRDLVVELCLAGERIVGDEASELLLDDLEAVEALGAVAHRLGASADDAWRSAFTDPAYGGLIHVPATQRSLVVVLHGGRVETEVLAAGALVDEARDALEAALNEFVRSSGARGGDALASARTALAEVLLPETVRARLRAWHRLAVVHPELIGHVPFELLEAAPGRPLGLEVVVEYWPSLAVHRALDAREDVEVTGPLALFVRTDAVPTGLTTRRPFRLPRGALDTWRDRIAPAHLDLALEEDATVDRLAVVAPGAAAVWIVAHGVVDEDRGSASGIALPSADGTRPVLRADDDRWLSSNAGAGLRMPRFVMLAACGAWRAPFRRGNDGRGHLPTRFLEAGANAVLLPYHDLRFSDHQAFAEAFLAALADGAPDAGAALLAARRAVAADARDPLARIAPLLFHLDGLAATGVPIRAHAAVQRAWWRRAGWTKLAGLAAVCIGAGLLLWRALRRQPAAA